MRAGRSSAGCTGPPAPPPPRCWSWGWPAWRFLLAPGSTPDARMRRPWPELALLGVAAAFALSFAGGSIWLDEAFTVQVAESPWARFWEMIRNENSPPLYYALLKGWIGMFGDGERALRALSALLAVAAVAPTIALGRELGGGSRASGLATGLLFACSAQLALHARAVRMYALVLLLSAVTTWLWARGLRRGGAPEAAPASGRRNDEAASAAAYRAPNEALASARGSDEAAGGAAPPAPEAVPASGRNDDEVARGASHPEPGGASRDGLLVLTAFA